MGPVDALARPLRSPHLHFRRKSLTDMSCSQGLAAHSTVDVDATWEKLETAFQQIHTKDASTLSFESLYREAYKLVLRKEGEALYLRLKKFERNWLSSSVAHDIISKTPVAELSAGNEASYTGNLANERRSAGEALLRRLRQAWDDHRIAMNMITDVMTYLVSRMQR